MMLPIKKMRLIVQSTLLSTVVIAGLFLYANANGTNENEAIDELKSDSSINDCAEVTIETNTGEQTRTVCYFPSKTPGSKDIHVTGKFVWNDQEGENKDLVLHTSGNIIFDHGSKIISKSEGDAIISLKSGIMPGEKNIYYSTVKFAGRDELDQVSIFGTGKIKIYYNPVKGREKHKYHNATIYSDYFSQLEPETYKLVNDVYDLQAIIGCLHGAFALSQDIDASITKDWNKGKGFTPIKNIRNGAPFSGVFDGNGMVIKNLYINRPNENYVGLFGDVTGLNDYRCIIKNFTAEKAFISGNKCVGMVLGEATGVDIFDIKVKDSIIIGNANAGKVQGCVLVNNHRALSTENTSVYEGGKLRTDAAMFGSCVQCEGDEYDEKNETRNHD